MNNKTTFPPALRVQKPLDVKTLLTKNGWTAAQIRGCCKSGYTQKSATNPIGTKAPDERDDEDSE